MWESESDNIVSKRHKVRDLNINHLKLEVHDTYKKDEKITTNFEPTDNSDVINKAYLDESLLKTNGHLSFLEKDYDEFKLQYDKKSVEETLILRAVKKLHKYFMIRDSLMNMLMLIKFWIFCSLQDVEVI